VDQAHVGIQVLLKLARGAGRVEHASIYWTDSQGDIFLVSGKPLFDGSESGHAGEEHRNDETLIKRLIT